MARKLCVSLASHLSLSSSVFYRSAQEPGQSQWRKKEPSQVISQPAQTLRPARLLIINQPACAPRPAQAPRLVVPKSTMLPNQTIIHDPMMIHNPMAIHNPMVSNIIIIANPLLIINPTMILLKLSV